MTTTPSVPVLGDDAFARHLDTVSAVDALEHALLGGLDVESDAPRLFSPLRSGEFLLMPSESAEHAGVKVVTIAPGNSARACPASMPGTCCSTPRPCGPSRSSTAPA